MTNFTLTFEWSRSKFKVTPILFQSLRIAAYGKEKDDPIIHVPYQSPIQGQALVFPPLPFPPFPLPDPILCLSLPPHFRPSLPNTLSLSPVFCPAWPRSIYPPIQLGRLGVMTSIWFFNKPNRHLKFWRYNYTVIIYYMFIIDPRPQK